MKNKKIFITILIILLVFISQYHIVKQKVLIIHDVDAKTRSLLYAPYGEFTLFFVHSVQKTPVYEFFEIGKDNTLSLTKTEFSSFGIGLPYTDEGGELSIKDDRLELKFNRDFDKIPIRVSPIPQHAIIINKKKYPLLDFAKPDNLIEIYAKDKFRLERRDKL